MSEDCPHCVFEKTEANCPGCFEGSHYRPKPITNADRIRAMSDEKLASLFGSTCDCDNACCFIHHEGVSCMNGCEAAWLEWLKKEVEE